MKNILLLTFFLGAILSTHAQSSGWLFTGPQQFPTNISGQINGIGRVCQIKFDPNNANTLYACSASGGLWISTNNAQSWKPLGTDFLPQMNTSSVCIDFTNSNIIYLSSGDPNYYSTDFGIWKSTDGGQSWNLSNTGIGNRMALELLMDPLDHLSLIAATNNGIWKTNDGGNTWSEKLTGNNFTDMKWMPLAGSSIIYASSTNKFFRSSDRGNTWTEITTGFSNLLQQGTRLAVSPANPAFVYVGSVYDEGTIFLSTDSGASFSIRYHDPNRSLTGYDTTGGGQGNYNFCIEADPLNPNQLYLASHNVWRSDDSGFTWTKLTNWWQTVHTDMHDWEFHPSNPNQLFQANDGGVWMTLDSGVNWVQTSDSLSATENYHAAASPLFARLISTGTQDNGELVYMGNEWKTNRGGDWTTRMMMDYSPQKFVYYFDDLERRPLPSGSGNTYNLPIGVTTTNIKHAFNCNPEIAFVAGNSVWRTNNLLAQNPLWTQIITGTATIRAIASAEKYPHLLAYSAANKIYISHDALSPSPTFVNYTLPVSGNATDIVISSADTMDLYIIIGNKVFRSNNGGQTFVDYSNQLPNLPQMKLHLDDYSTKQSLYVGNSMGVFHTDTTLGAWSAYNNGLPTIASIEDFMYFNDGGEDARLFITYYGRGTWEQKLENTHSCATPSITSHQWLGNQYQIQWSGTGMSFDIQYRPEAEMNWNTLNITGNNFPLSQYQGCTRYELRVRAHCGNDSSLWSQRIYFETPSNQLNNDFDNHQDIGNTGAAGSVCFDSINQRYTIYAAGDDIWGSADQFHYLYKKVHGDVSISARVRYIGNIYSWAKAGVMMRESLDMDSKHTLCALTPGNGFANQWRSSTAGSSDNKDTSGAAPGWVKLERTGNVFEAYFSTNGSNWELLNSTTIAMNDSIYLGLANCSHIDGTLNDAIFDQIIINGTVLQTADLNVKQPMIQVSPNPANHLLNVQFKQASKSKEIHFRVIDQQGQVKLNSHQKGGQLNYTLQIESLPSGVYYLQIEDQLRHAIAFIKQ
jgi:photosystem II stability/assembly factor-like uncharacterized protein/regulation of enolase protein 1 (concanavalin A-like superfamily)